MAFERLVRPAQTPDNQPPTQFRQRRTSANWQPIVLKFGVGGELTTGSASISQSVNYYATKRPKETTASTSFFGTNLGLTWP